MHGGMSAASVVAKEHAAKATQAAVVVPALLESQRMAVIPSQSSAGTVVQETGQPQKEHIVNIKGSFIKRLTQKGKAKRVRKRPKARRVMKGHLTTNAVKDYDELHHPGNRHKFPRVTLYTLSGERCGPRGLGALKKAADGSIISDTRLTVPGHFTPLELSSSFPHWSRFGTPDEKKNNDEWESRMEVRIVVLTSSGQTSKIAVSKLPIGCNGTQVTAIVSLSEPIIEWEERESDTQLLDGVITPSTPSPSGWSS